MRWPSGAWADSLGTWQARRSRASSLIEAEPSELPPIALDEHYERVTWIGAAVDDEQSVEIRSGGDANAEAGPDALLARVIQARDRLGVLLAETSPDRPVLVPWQGGRCAATTSWSCG